MKTKAISLTLAGLMSLQSVGFAQQDRTANIGDQAIAAAQSNLKALNTQILTLDQALGEAQAAIEKRDSRGGIKNAAAVTAAVAGLALTASAFWTSKLKTEGAGLGAMALGVVSVGATLSSLGAGLTSQVLKPKVDVTEVNSKIVAAQNDVKAALAQTKDLNQRDALVQVGLRLQNTLEALASYKDQESEVSRNRLASQGTQLVGSMLLTYGILRDSSALVGNTGAILMSASNVAAIVSGFQGSEAKEVLKQIKHTRESLRTASAALN